MPSASSETPCGDRASNETEGRVPREISGEVEVRRMAAGDLAAVARLCAELGYPVEARELRARWEDLAESGEDAVFVADLSGDVAGWVHIGAARALTHPSGSEIRGLVVRRDS